MSSSSGPTIPLNGLVFHYDIANTQKSWKGKPTTNLLSNPTNEVIGTTSEFVQYADLAPIFNTNGLVPYSLSLDLKAQKPGQVLVYMQNGSSTKYSFVSQSVNVTSNYQRFTFNNITPAISTASDTYAILAFYGVYGSGVIPSIKNVQVELGTTSTPFVSGTRSISQALVDLTGNNTITANNLTYNSDGTFSFDGVGNYLDVYGSAFTNTMNEYSICFWAKRDAEGRMPIAGRTSTAFYWYGDYSWAYTHGGVWGEHYYSKPTSIPLGSWGFYCVAYNGSNVSIYRQGIFQSSANTTGTADFSQGLKIGYWAGGGGYAWNGMISSVQFYNRALPSDEVRQLFNAQRSKFGI